jgi:O-antigen ligase
LGAGVAMAGRGAESGAGLGGDIARSAADALQLKGTAAERLGSWQQLVKTWAKAGPREWIIGQPSGTGYERYVSDDLSARRIAYQPHNFYVELLVSQGLAGLTCFLALVITALRGTWAARHHAQHGPAARWLFVMLVFQLTYYSTYGVEYLQSFFLGAALAIASALRPAASADEPLVVGVGAARSGRTTTA